MALDACSDDEAAAPHGHTPASAWLLVTADDQGFGPFPVTVAVP